VQEAEESGRTVVELFPESEMAGVYRSLGTVILSAAGAGETAAEAAAS
jgi:nitrogenase subunit NifH